MGDPAPPCTGKEAPGVPSVKKMQVTGWRHPRCLPMGSSGVLSVAENWDWGWQSQKWSSTRSQSQGKGEVWGLREVGWLAVGVRGGPGAR